MNDKDKAPVTIEGIIAAVKKYEPKANTRLIRRAYDLAKAAHKGQTRVSGEEYIIHPLHVAQILTELHIDDVTISAALLHDVVEDTIYTNEQIADMFGEEVAMIVDGVTKLGRIKYKSKEEVQLENYRKMFLAMAKDIRVIMVKLADRLHNMRTLKYMREDKQKRIAKETIEIYAPLANRLGISNIKWELEDLCLRYLEPETYYDLVENVKQKRRERQAFIDTSIEQIREKLDEANIKADINGRAKHFYSIYKKMKRDNKSISEIYDLSAIRVLVESVKDCYGVLGVIHAMWKPIPGRFKDYIAMPKSNGYQSLHTTVMTRGYPLEIQIRTYKMHQVSEYGVAAHWKYKEAGKGATAGNAVDQKMNWLRQMVNLQQELSDPKEYFEALKVDIFSDEVFVFTPKGDVVDLPKGSNPIDFAYRIHTEVGHHCVGAKVNGKMVPLEYKLKNGDIVSVVTNKANNGPSRDWLNIVASSETRSKIRSWFKKERREENIERGMELIKGEAKRLGYAPKELIKEGRLLEVAKKLNILSEDDLLAALGYGGITVHGIMTKLIELHKKELKANTPVDVSKMLSELKQPQHNGKKSKSSHGVLVEGESGLLVRLARCCNPIPGDPITGYVTRGRGVSVHRSDCPNVLKDTDFSRMIEVGWDIGLDKVYTVELEIVCNDKSGMLTSVLAVPTEMKINIHSVNASPNRSNKTSTIMLGLEVRNSTQVTQIMTKLRRLKDVFSVTRKMGSSLND
ncbi:MAG: bifunctional (p)ppGpp synthetase/guanosine-3',5'-bis(diphosphate) 3'-pyrophosphohydrolase [Selenomonas sp.]|nr:bifunctional (p)ppGpp synthetase/guanosine-3',5'-bis(diphosphate) 3'-pyrophosphohydrolase [Selenomonadales bacterium]MDD7763494.1 bifunctional (p)ppGpp synthetase/guanosine-3',5'-bis(diphosphate) 3'-pyrophosphohydrolase [Selenomonadales bacterium]MDY5716658.1 bifunctional (p)ppGpp synthetase/guanosine-3',5'-bis(diphosphate) 3'-pyrophosphohydrolase [Selenomonas sp.]